MCSYIGSDALVLRSIGESIQVCHGYSHVGAWCLVDLLISNHVESVAKVVWGELLLLICSPLSTICVTLFALLSLFISFVVDNWFVIADVKNQISSLGWKDRKAGKTREVRWYIQVVVFVLGV